MSAPYVDDAHCYPDSELQRLARPGTDCDRLNRHQAGPETEQVGKHVVAASRRIGLPAHSVQVE
jgi:hypothetical protein